MCIRDRYQRRVRGTDVSEQWQLWQHNNMVNFGSRLNKCPKPAWTNAYVCYDKLKQIIAGFCGGTLQISQFSDELEQSLSTVDQTCLEREQQLKQIKSSICLELANNAEPSQSVKTRLAFFSQQLDELRHYINWNYMAVIKIVKKRNKNAAAFSNSAALDAEAILLQHHFYISPFVAKMSTFLTASQLTGSADPSQFTCSICLESLKNPVSLPCNHRFCFECISNCVQSNEQAGLCVSCALCRRHVLFTPEAFKVDTTLTAFLIGELGFPAHEAPHFTDSTLAAQRLLEHQQVAEGKLIEPYEPPTEKDVPSKCAAPQNTLDEGIWNDDFIMDLASYLDLEGLCSPEMLATIPQSPKPAAPLEEWATLPEPVLRMPVVCSAEEPRAPSAEPALTVAEPPQTQASQLLGCDAPAQCPETVATTQHPECVSETFMSCVDALLNPPDLPKPVPPTKTGRRRRMIPISTIDQEVGLVKPPKEAGSNKRQKIDLPYCRERNRQAAAMFRVRDQHYIAQLEDAISQLEARNTDLTHLKTHLETCQKQDVGLTAIALPSVASDATAGVPQAV
eukprot:TRINITY_DN2597_c0_g1_i3.p1 TRINITY_DN2597_c0_g1~~TRINITY_DN2597_c0_g1_i3.p1  ORF type:complete len:565 (+),score=91.58 TRINITY_DN2597_c0_g1_i3:146-1840(+)